MGIPSHSPRSTSGQTDITELKDWHSLQLSFAKGQKPMEIITLPLIRAYEEDEDFSYYSIMC
jgi:hypothetical protein